MHYKQYKKILSPRGGMNIYRGCQHGCIYCDSRSKCYQMEHDFEDIEVKLDAPIQLESELRRRRKKCMIGTGSMCDPYMPIETELNYSRQCFEAVYRCGFGLTLITKSNLVLRDAELLRAINEQSKCVVQMTLTTFDEELCRIIEPKVCTSRERYLALLELKRLGIPTIVWLCPLLPYINDTEENLRGILGYCFDAGVVGIICSGIGVTLRDGDREYFFAALDEHFPGMKQRYLQKFGLAYECLSEHNRELMKIFHEECEKHSVMHNNEQIFNYIYEFPPPKAVQLSLFDM